MLDRTGVRPFWSRCGSTSLGRDGAISNLKERLHGGRALGCHLGSLADGSLSSKILVLRLFTPTLDRFVASPRMSS